MTATCVLPRSCARICPAKVALTKLKHPGMVETLKLFGHVVCNMPDSSAMLIVNLTVVPYLRKKREGRIMGEKV
jgi:hypothetical protein